MNYGWYVRYVSFYELKSNDLFAFDNCSILYRVIHNHNGFIIYKDIKTKVKYTLDLAKPNGYRFAKADLYYKK